MNYLQSIYLKLIQWINNHAKKYLAKKEHEFNQKNTISIIHLDYRTVSKKLKTKIYLHTTDLNEYVNTIIVINNLIKVKNKELVIPFSYGNYHTTEYTLYDFVYVREKYDVVFTGIDFISNLLENSIQTYNDLIDFLEQQDLEYKQHNYNLMVYFIADLKNIIKVFSSL